MNDDPAAEAAESAEHDELIEKGWAAWKEAWSSPDGPWTTRGAVAAAIAAVEPIIAPALRARVASLESHLATLKRLDNADTAEIDRLKETVALRAEVAALTKRAADLRTNIDWPLLREQKRDLVILIDNRREHYEEDDSLNQSLMGILHLIDTVQDHAVDNLGMPAETVFGEDRDT